MIPQKTIEDLIHKHSTLEKDLSSGNLDKKLFAEKSKEYSDLNEIVEDAKKYISFDINFWDKWWISPINVDFWSENTCHYTL